MEAEKQGYWLKIQFKAPSCWYRKEPMVQGADVLLFADHKFFSYWQRSLSLRVDQYFAKKTNVFFFWKNT